MDFFQIQVKEKHRQAGREELYPVFRVREKNEDLMIRGGSFYAIWDQEQGIWSQNEYDVQRLVDEELYAEAKRRSNLPIDVKDLETSSWKKYKEFVKNSPDHFHQLDSKLVFSNSQIRKTDYASKRLPYPLEAGDFSAWSELVDTLYGPEQRLKIEWAIGSIVAGDSKKIQKFLVFYGPPATGKSTILNIIGKLFEGYTTYIEASKLASSISGFATEPFKNNPLVAIQHDGDLSRIDDNTELNSAIAHEEMLINEKYKAKYSMRINAMLFIGSNQPVKISDAKSGIIRRLIDVHPTGVRLPPDKYEALLDRIQFELGAIAYHCLQVYRDLGPKYYNSYQPQEMMLQTDVFYNFIEAYYDEFKRLNDVSLKEAYAWYKDFCAESGISRPMPQYKMREELRNYFDSYGTDTRGLYKGFNAEKFKYMRGNGEFFSLALDNMASLFDEEMAECPAQYAKVDGSPKRKWESVRTKLKDIDTHELHYTQVPHNHIVIDFDLEGSLGKTALDRNLEAASHWPPTYAEVSRSGDGVHLHYHYTGKVEQLASQYGEGIEIKTYPGDSALRRRLTLCNAVPIADISSGLPLKEKKEKMLKEETMASERSLRKLIERNLNKEIHPGTKSSVDFIKKILDDAYESGMTYDVTDLRTKIISFAGNSTHQANTALKVVKEMKWASETTEEKGDQSYGEHVVPDDDRLVFFDVEVYPNLFVICWKFQGEDTIVKMINPSAEDVKALFKLKLVGFYNRRFDNHILWAASMGASNEDLFKLTRKIIIDSNKGATFGSAYNLSYADIWDFSSERMSLKKFEIKLGILHMELDLPWDKAVDEKDWPKIVEYCANDVRATEAVFEDRKGDFVARQILAELSGLTVNDTTQNHTAKIILGKGAKTKAQFIYTDLSTEFPGYKFELGKSSYRGEDPGEGGYVYSEPGIYENVAVLDIVSMHPTTIEVLNLFGPYTKNFSDLKQARVYIKHGEFDKAREMLDGRLAPYLQDESTAEQLAYALKIVINTVYGLTSARFDNPFRDSRNVDNIVAKRGALFMIDLKHHLQDKGYIVAHIKTDSVKIPEANGSVIATVLAFGLTYSYEFEHEITYDKLCLVNDAVYIARKGDEWTAVGAQFQHPYVFKSLFSGEEITFDDLCEARTVVKGTMYLDKEQDVDSKEPPDLGRMRHLGRTGRFVPVLEDGGILYRVNEDKFYLVASTKGHLWMEANVAEALGDQLKIDMTYFDKLKADAIETIEKFGSFEEFINGSSKQNGARPRAHAYA
jgi:Family of unknown function (DUF5906)